MMNRFFRSLFIALCFFCLAENVSAQLKVAVAANLQAVIKVLQQGFKQRTGVMIEPIIGASGSLVAQISNGAPFDVFLSADMTFPEILVKNGFSDQKPVVYALGSLIVCSSQNMDLKNWKKLLLTNAVQKIAIANPATAPYGKAAEQALQKNGLLDQSKSKTVYGESISQVNTYITTGVVSLGFTTQALVADPAEKGKLFYQLIPVKSYEPIQQGMVILKHAQQGGQQQAEQFYRYMLSGHARAILKKYGYITP